MDWLLFSMLADGAARVSGHTPPWLLCRSFCLTTQSRRGRARAGAEQREAERAVNCGLDPTILTPGDPLQGLPSAGVLQCCTSAIFWS